MPYSQNGNFATGFAARVDTNAAGGAGTDDWIVDNALSKNECFTSYCVWSVTVYRALDTGDAKDAIFKIGDEYYVQTAFKRFTAIA